MKKILETISGLLKEYLKPFLIFFLILALLSGASAVLYLELPRLFQSGAYPEKIKYSIFGQTVTVKADSVLRDGILTVDIAKICLADGMTLSGDSSCLTLSTKSGETCTFRHNSDIAEVNGTEVRMELPAKIAGYTVNVPLSFVKAYIPGLKVTQSEDLSELEIAENAESEFFFSLQKQTELLHVSAEGVRLEIVIDESELDYEFVNDLSEFKKYMNPENRNDFLTYFSFSNPTDSTFEPDGLLNSVNPTKNNSEIKLNICADKALEAMFREMASAGIKNMKLTRGYVSYASQEYNYKYYVDEQRLYYHYNFSKTGKYFTDLAYEILGENYLKSVYIDNGKYYLSYTNAYTVVNSFYAPPGAGDNITGLGVTIHNLQDESEDFKNTDAYAWLKENAYKFGFIERFPEGKEKLTSFDYKPCRWRFVGQYHAAIMHREGYCLEEYLAFLGLGG